MQRENIFLSPTIITLRLFYLRFPGLFYCFTLLLFCSSCTGLNLKSWPVPFSPNMHPSSSYAEGGVFFKGGLIFHNDSQVLYSGKARLEKLGKSCSHSFFYLIAFGSSRIYDAKVSGAVSHIGMIEQEVFSILGGVYHRHCTIVLGEDK